MKSPAYAKRLIELRRSGTHPAVITVIYGNDWRVADDVVRLAVKPGEALGLNWAAVAGLPVQLIDRAREDEDPLDDAGNRELYDLLGEMALFAAAIEVITPYALTTSNPANGPGRAQASELAFCSRQWDPEKRCMCWPRWWSDDIAKAHGKNAQRWQTEIAQAVAA